MFGIKHIVNLGNIKTQSDHNRLNIQALQTFISSQRLILPVKLNTIYKFCMRIKSNLLFS